MDANGRSKQEDYLRMTDVTLLGVGAGVAMPL